MIPKIIFQTSRNKPEQYVIDKIISKCPDWKYFHYNDVEIKTFFNENYIEEFKDIVKKFDKIPRGQHKADLFRYYYLYLNGGVFIDSDAMVEMNIENIIKDYTFFSVDSYYNPHSIFQGFIGSTPKNKLIYLALKDAYNIDINLLSNDYHLLCKNLYKIIKNNTNNLFIDSTNDKIHLYREKYYNNDCAEIYNNDNKTVLLHYFGNKIIPR